jgi:hypothetical protein
MYTPDGDRLHDVGLFVDGTLYNPRHYPEDVVRAAIGAAMERRQVRRHVSAKQAAATRQVRRERRIYQLVQRYRERGAFTPATHCALCRRALTDPASLARGIGSECWSEVLAHLTTVEIARSLSQLDRGGPAEQL